MELKILDHESYNSIDISNGQRVIRALEVTIGTGRKFSSFKTGRTRKRDFEIVKIGLTRPREVLYDRIDRRVDMMIEAGLVEEVQSLVQYRNMPALNTVGYKEIFDYLDGNHSLEEAVRLIKRNTRHYAKRQLTYWGRDEEIKWLEIGNQLPSSETNLILTSLTSSSV
jgi:tRNA dimethylallyltransferase